MTKPSSKTRLNLASERLGASVLAANDEFFAVKENLIKDAAPIWDPDRYTDHGKWMDGWETRRRRQPGHDWCVVKLAAEGVVSRIIVDTANFTGNFPESCSVEACHVDGDPAIEDLEDAAWETLVPQTELDGDTEHMFPVKWPFRVTHIRLNIFPDGGVARMRILGRIVPDPLQIAGRSLVLSSSRLGGRIVDASDSYFSAPFNLLLDDEPRGMHDGWETRRRRGPGNDWVVLGMAAPGLPTELEISTKYFKGNAPGSCSVEVLPGDVDYEPDLPDDAWLTLLPESTLKPHTDHRFSDLEPTADPVRIVRISIYPDGGLARVRVHGSVGAGEHLTATCLERINSAPEAEAEILLRACCGSDSWVDRVAEARPFTDLEALLATATEAFDHLSDDDWLQAFKAHPEIGRIRAEVARGRRAADWSANEQRGVSGADEEVRERLDKGNAAYRDRFGFIFIISAEARSADEILEALDTRLANSPKQELQNAAREERKIAINRLRRLVTP